MKKIFSLILSSLIIASMSTVVAQTYDVVPKAPYISPALKPAIAKYKQGNYVGSMQDLQDILKKDKNYTYAKYYLALCYTRLGYKEEAQKMYKEVIARDDNMALSYYSQRAIDCLDDPNGERCNPNIKKDPHEGESQIAEEEEVSKTKKADEEMTKFIESGQKIHPSAMDSITKERLERKVRESEMQRREQMEQNPNLKSDASMPTNEEIAAALNTLSKIGLNPINQLNQFNPLAQANLYNQYGYLGNTGNSAALYGALPGGVNSLNSDIAKMYLYNMPQMALQNSLMNYGI